MINLFITQNRAKVIHVANKKAVKFIYIDLFCGAGGTSTGILKAKFNGDICAIVAACVNHDPKAIKSHWLNHPEVVHYEEDIRTLELKPLVDLINLYRIEYPHAKIVLWASLECTNFSKAKGGQPRDADSRTLAEHLDRYISALNPDLIQIENVVEFMSWGPLIIACKKKHKNYSELKTLINKRTGKKEYAWVPESKKNGRYFQRWKERINSYGYYNEWRELNSADYGAYTSRNRLFGCFARHELPIVFPEPTHSKKIEMSDLFGQGLKRWKAVKDVLDFEDEGISIFNRKTPLVANTLERIYAGLIKFVATSDLINASFLAKYYGTGDNVQSIEEPSGTLTTKDRFSKIQAIHWLDKQYSGKHNHQSIDNPAGTIMTCDKHSIVKAESFIFNPGWFGHSSSTSEPCVTIIARQDKAPLYLLNVNISIEKVAIPVYDDEPEIMRKIKEFMAFYGICDIKMRMLKVSELLPIQGFPVDYKLFGNRTDQKKFIGNSVVPDVVKCWVESMVKKFN